MSDLTISRAVGWIATITLICIGTHTIWSRYSELVEKENRLNELDKDVVEKMFERRKDT